MSTSKFTELYTTLFPVVEKSEKQKLKIQSFMDALDSMLRLESGNLAIAAIYLERLKGANAKKKRYIAKEFKYVILTLFILADKMWNDLHFQPSEYIYVLRVDYKIDLYQEIQARVERRMLGVMGYNLFITLDEFKEYKIKMNK